jgi:ribulose 1,5-bisphosphate synthetase/thiazole synthase
MKMISAKCPKCEKLLTHVNIGDLPIHENFKERWKGVVYACPYCNTALSVAIDPVALKTDTVNAILNKG